MAGDIVCGVDDSIGARRAVDVAIELAAELSKRLILVHVTGRDSRFPYGDRARRERRRHAAWQRGQAVFSALERQHRLPTDVQERVEAGDPATELARVVEEEGAELLVVGSRARGDIRSALLGSVSQSLERLAPCALVVVPPGASAGAGYTPNGRSIVCGIADPDAQTSLVEYSASLAGALSTRLEIVHASSEQGWDIGGLTAPLAKVWPPEGEGDPYGERPLVRFETAMHLADAHGVPADARLAAGPAARVLDRVAKREGGRLIVIGSRGGGRLRSLLRGSVSRQLAEVGTTPIVIVPQHAYVGDDGPLPPRSEANDADSESHSERHGAAVR